MVTKFNWHKIGWLVAIETGAIIIIASFFLPGGADMYEFYLPFAQGCLQCGFVPYFAQWILWPLSFFPPLFVWPIWTAISVVGFLALCWYLKTNPAIVILSFPAMGQFWLGQIDVVVSAGLVIALLAANPYLRGGGILLALVKPQLAGLAVLLLLAYQPRRELLKVLLIPVAVMLLSFLRYGLTWPLEWLAFSTSNLPAHVWRQASTLLWPYGIIFAVAIFLVPPLRPRFEVTLMVSALVTPFFSVYSYLIFLLFRAPWWSLPLSYIWFIMYPLYDNGAMRFAWVLPLGLVGYLLFKHRANPERQGEQTQ